MYIRFSVTQLQRPYLWPSVQEQAKLLTLLTFSTILFLLCSDLSAGKSSWNPFKSPYRSAIYRLEKIWTLSPFLPFGSGWLRYSYLTWMKVFLRENVKQDLRRSLMLLSSETRLGFNLFMACPAFVELVEYLFTLPGVWVFLGHRICQDNFWSSKTTLYLQVLLHICCTFCALRVARTQCMYLISPLYHSKHCICPK